MIHPTGHALTCANIAAWGAVGGQLIFRVFDLQVFAAMLAAALALTIMRALNRHSERVQATTTAHAKRVESAILEHTKAMKDHVLALERFFQMGLKGHVIASVDVAEQRSRADTGPFKVYNGGGN